MSISIFTLHKSSPSDVNNQQTYNTPVLADQTNPIGTHGNNQQTYNTPVLVDQTNPIGTQANKQQTYNTPVLIVVVY